MREEQWCEVTTRVQGVALAQMEQLRASLGIQASIATRVDEALNRYLPGH